jgi:hypothetical protein
MATTEDLDEAETEKGDLIGRAQIGDNSVRNVGKNTWDGKIKCRAMEEKIEAPEEAAKKAKTQTVGQIEQRFAAKKKAIENAKEALGLREKELEAVQQAVEEAEQAIESRTKEVEEAEKQRAEAVAAARGEREKLGIRIPAEHRNDQDGNTYPRNVAVSDSLNFLSERWYCKEQMYQSGANKGNVYSRFYSVDGKHKGLMSANKCIDIDAADRSYDAVAYRAIYKRNLKDKRQRRDEARRLEQNQDGNTFPRNVPVSDFLHFLSERWYSKEQIYQSGAYEGEVYGRFYSLDGRHKCLMSANECIDIDAADQRYDAVAYRAIYRAAVLKDKRQRLWPDEQKTNGLMKGQTRQKREEAIQRFQDKFGNLSGPVVQAFPGWETTWKHRPDCDKIMTKYTDPGGLHWFLLKDLEAFFGFKMEAGEDISDIIDAGLAGADKDLFSQGYQNAKTTNGGTFVYTQDGKEPKNREKYLARLAEENPEGHIENQKKSKRQRRCLRMDAAAALKHAGAPSAEELARAGEETPGPGSH